MARLTFAERNKGTYQKVSDVPRELIDKYKGLLPDELVKIWETMGFGIFEDGFFQLVNPDEYEFVFDFVDTMLEPSIVYAITALGDIVLWEGSKNWTISPEEGNRNLFINVRKCNSHVIGDMEFILDFVLGSENNYGIIDKDYFASKPYLDIKGKLPQLQYGQCYGYVPALVLGGSASVKNLKVVDSKSYINSIGQAAGKIIGLKR
ncbi:GAD-like domain-containing protein [Breznakiellaceae bacterium SP9]